MLQGLFFYDMTDTLHEDVSEDEQDCEHPHCDADLLELAGACVENNV